LYRFYIGFVTDNIANRNETAHLGWCRRAIFSSPEDLKKTVTASHSHDFKRSGWNKMSRVDHQTGEVKFSLASYLYIIRNMMAFLRFVYGALSIYQMMVSDENKPVDSIATNLGTGIPQFHIR
jgi:hypothetical protein